MSFKTHEQPLNDTLVGLREQDVMDGINKLIDQRLLLTLAKIIPNEPDAATIVSDPDIQAKSNELKSKVAEIISAHQDIISTIARSKLDKDDDVPVVS